MKIISLDEYTPIEDGDGVRKISASLKDDNGERSNLNIDENSPHWSAANDLIEDFKNGDLTNDELADGLYNLVNRNRTVVEENFVTVQGVLGDRMKLSNSGITIDYEPIDKVLEAHVLRLIKEDGTAKNGQNWASFARFIEKLYSNVNQSVRDQLFGWLNYENLHGKGFTLTSDGDFIGYKGCDGTVDNPKSINRGHAIVDGKSYNGSIPNKIGSIVEMPRSEVQDNPAVGCAAGLHVGTYNYASNWARGVLLTVVVNPADVVSVPVECDAQKIRVCRYKVLDTTEQALDQTTYYSDDYDEHNDCYGSDVSLDEVEIDDVINFDYVKANGEHKNYTITVQDFDDEHMFGLNQDEEWRSFILDNIVEDSVKVLSDDENESDESEDNDCNCDCDDESVSLDDVDEGDVISFDYVKANGDRKSYTITVEDFDDSRLFGTDEDNNFKSFNWDGIIENSVKFVKDDNDVVDVDSNTLEEFFKSQLAQKESSKDDEIDDDIFTVGNTVMVGVKGTNYIVTVIADGDEYFIGKNDALGIPGSTFSKKDLDFAELIDEAKEESKKDAKTPFERLKEELDKEREKESKKNEDSKKDEPKDFLKDLKEGLKKDLKDNPYVQDVARNSGISEHDIDAFAKMIEKFFKGE